MELPGLKEELEDGPTRGRPAFASSSKDNTCSNKKKMNKVAAPEALGVNSKRSCLHKLLVPLFLFSVVKMP